PLRRPHHRPRRGRVPGRARPGAGPPVGPRGPAAPGHRTRIDAADRGRDRAARVARDRRDQVPAPARAGTPEAEPRVSWRAAGSPARALQGVERIAPLRLHAARGRGRAPLLPVLRRAGVQGALHLLRDRRHEPRRALEQPARAHRSQRVRDGDLESSPERHVGKATVRVWSVPGKSALTEFALDAAVESLRRLETYFDLPYPYEKLDLVAVPDFEAGAMENAGAVFFRETLLLVDPKTITVAEKKRVAEVIAHELAHMWFGNLVTMKWWDDLWLNEAFATWMAFKIVDDWKPEWRMWNNFEPHRAAALALDALANTHPIYAEVENAAQATENFDAITYEKGASVVRMIEHYLGPQKFRVGVRSYIRRHREANAVAADLWRALEQASGQPVAQVAKVWIRQPGFPLVSLSLEERGESNAIAVKQERFLASPITRVPRSEAGVWPVPLVV